MEKTIYDRIKAAEIVSLSFLAFFLIICLLELMVRTYIHISLLLCAGVLFFSTAAVLGIDENNLNWQLPTWSATMKVFMSMLIVFMLLLTTHLLCVRQIIKERHGPQGLQVLKFD